MGIGTLKVDPELLAVVPNLLPGGCKIVGSNGADPGHADVVLLIRAPEIVDGEALRCEISDRGLCRTVTVVREEPR